MILLLLSCATDAEPALVALGNREQLIRLSVDLRGVHPSEEELLAIEADLDLYDQYVDRYLADPRFLDRVEEILNTRMLTRDGRTYFDPGQAGLVVSDADVADSVGDEPLKLARHIVDNDLPWSELVLADYTMADPVLAAMWDLEHEGEGWATARYRDGRPHAGVLTMTTTWLRYPSAGVNANRHRANAVSRILLCDDYLARPVSFERSQIDAITTGDPEQVIADTPTCQSCHSSLDPLAAHFFGFWWDTEDAGLDEGTLYRPEDENLWRDHADREPGFYGHPTADIQDLAGMIAEDPRFADCAVETFFEGLTQRRTTDADWEELALHRNAFSESNQHVKTLVRSIVLSPEYRARSTSDPELAERLVPVKTLGPHQLESVVEDITGYRWSFDGRGISDNAEGLAVLAGGIDSRDVVEGSHDPSVGLLSIQERLAWSAAHHVVGHDLDPARTEDAILLRYVTHETRPPDEAFEAQIRSLYVDVTGLPLAEEAREPALMAQLWTEVHTVNGDPDEAWATVLSVVLRDPHLLFY